MTLNKVWVNGFAGDQALLTITGGITTPVTTTSTAPTNSGTSTPVNSGAPITVSEALSGAGAYTSTLLCVQTGTTTEVPGSSDGTFTMPNTPVTCTYTNTRTRTP